MAWYEKATDDFNRANANPIGGDWVTVTGWYACQVYSNKLARTQTANANNRIYWNGVALADNQYARATNLTYLGYCVVGVRQARSTADTSYHLYYYSTTGQPYKVIAGSYTTLGSAFILGAPDGLSVETNVVGTGLDFLLNGTSKATRTDSSLTSGTSILGLAGVYDVTTYGFFDNFSCGDDQAPAAVGHPTMSRWGGVPYMTLGRRKW
jgi:hypothetical protein